MILKDLQSRQIGRQIADFALRERSRSVTVAARRSFLWEREVTALSGPAAPAAAAVGDVRLAARLAAGRQDVVGPVVDGGAGQPLGAGLAVGTGAAAVLVNRSSVLGRVKWLFPGRRPPNGTTPGGRL